MRRTRLHLQHAALPFATKGDEFQVLLVTSRDTGRWVIPKGWPEKGLAPHQVAEKEAFEEAGVTGIIGTRPISTFEYVKQMDAKRGLQCLVDIYPLRVAQELDWWPEKDQRTRAWMSPSQAAKLVTETGLIRLLLSLGTDPDSGSPLYPEMLPARG